ncbi:alpha/beta fold hydrolase [Mycolicibacterium litorale]|uniref:Carboxylesterase n=1 Tax=Mycolicibacterium litorale TaxID=758802 RepID=A0AAD1MUZ0_9MYCO|nr:alpha/beta hydrolase [Mycolicibacterium litorale]TDY09497.1 pimeloyl-ACP methyl ester carboxylesterase [Mycolicibacterium litorale]BBY17443.1 carboxylesterase [Mycolicibacterium litorale]
MAKGVGHYRSAEAYEHFLAVYRDGMATLPPFDAQFDVPTAFGTVRAYRFPGHGPGTPVLLLPGRNASTPMYATNLPSLLARRTVYSIDRLGEAGLSVQTASMRGADDDAQWLDEALAGLGLDQVHLMGVSMGGWTTVNYAARRPGRAASLVLLDPVMTFDRIPVPTLFASVAMFAPGVPESIRRRVVSWISGGADVDDVVMEARLIDAASRDFVLKLPAPKPITDDQLRSLEVPVLALLGGRSVMLRADRAAERARNTLPHGQIEVWSQASHAINGEYPDEIAERAHRFWDSVDA